MLIRKKQPRTTIVSMHRADRPDEYILEIDNLCVNYETNDGIVRAVEDVSLKLKPQKTLGLVGETGAGKTTLARAVLNLVPNPPGVIRSGSIHVNKKDVFSLSKLELEHFRGGVASMIFQDPMTSLNPVITVGKQIEETVMVHNPGLTKQEAAERAREMLEMVGIPADRSNEYPHQFSGGMKQRVTIAIALACNPQLLLADEPTTALDVTIQAQVLEVMKDLKMKYGMTMLLITHDLGIVAEFCDDVAVMYAGRVVEQGTLSDVFDHTRHPYTEGLFNTLPNIYDRKAMLRPIPGLMPDPYNLPAGCAFAPRCQYATEACSVNVPEEKWISDTHLVACRAYDDPNFALKWRHDCG